MEVIPSFVSRYLSILIDAYDEGEVEVHFSYVVSKVKWTPRYDIRVYSRDNALKVSQRCWK